MSDVVSCPHCGKPFELSKAMQESVTRLLGIEKGRIQLEVEAQTRERLEAETAEKKAELLRLERELRERERQGAVDLERKISEEAVKIRLKAEADARDHFDAQARQKDAELEVARGQAAEAKAREAGLLRRERELQEKQEGAALELEHKLSAETEKIRQKAEADARVRFEAKEKEAIAELTEARSQAADAKAKEGDLLRRERELREKEASAAVEFEQKLVVETERIRQKSDTEARIRFEVREKETDAELAEARRQAADAKAKEGALLRRERELREKEASAAVELERKLASETERIRQKADEDARIRFEVKAKETEADLAEARRLISEANAKEAEFLRRDRELREKEETAAIELERRLSEGTEKIRQRAEAEAEARFEVKAKEQEIQVEKARKLVAESTARETDLLQRERALQERESQTALDYERKLNSELERVRTQAAADAKERLDTERTKNEFSSQEHRAQIEGLQKKLAEVQQKLVTQPAHAHGEAQEVLLRDLLVRTFHRDQIQDVPVGTAGSDVMQRLIDENGQKGGLIIWESKRTKSWSDSWLAKLRDDQRACAADAAVLVSAALPPDVHVFGLKEGIWVVSWAAVVPVAMMLRTGLLEVASARRANESRGEKMALLYDYLTGNEFRNRFLAVIEAYQEMRTDLEDERKALLKIWSKREKQLQRAVENLASFYGDVQGIAGRSLGDIEPLALPAGSDAQLPSGNSPGGESVRDGLIRELTEILFGLVPEGGEGVGNKTLCDLFTKEALVRLHTKVGEAEYSVCKEMLLAQQRIKRGPGQGGSVARIQSTTNRSASAVSSKPRVAAEPAYVAHGTRARGYLTFHKPRCTRLTPGEMTIEFALAEDARAAGLIPCDQCLPDLASENAGS